MDETTPGVLARGPLAAPPRTLLDVLRASALAHPDASALEDADGAMSYRELMAAVIRTAARLADEGVARGDRVGVRMPSGTRELYIAILGVLAAGAAYVPVDADDPEERARLVFGEARVAGVITGRGRFVPAQGAAPPGATSGEAAAAAGAVLFEGEAPHPSTAALPIPTLPGPDDDAWIIFTSGSTGTPKGVAVSHRSAAAFVDAESRLFLQEEPIGPGDRVLAGLSVAFDASCEEMWLAWAHGACLVPAPRSLVRSGMDLGPWLTLRGITIVSTVPTLASLWPASSLESVRLLIFGGEACPPELVERLATEGREVWNTYGPTEATVVACAAQLAPGQAVRIGLPLDGWDLAVVDEAGQPVADGEVGELIIGGVGLARYLDPAKDAEKYAPLPSLGWSRAYRSGDLVRFDRGGLFFQGRADDQVKVGGRRIELGEIEAALGALPGVHAAAVVVQRTDAGNDVLVGYVGCDVAAFDREQANERLRAALPAAIVPVLAPMPELPTRTSGKVDKRALPWPLEDAAFDAADAVPGLAALAADWQAVLGLPATSEDDDFFALGGGSLAAAQLVTRIRQRDPQFTVADIYAYPRLGAMAAELAARSVSVEQAPESTHVVARTPRDTQWLQSLLGIPLLMLGGVRWLLFALTAATILRTQPGFEALPAAEPWLLILGLVIFATPFGRMAIAVAAARLLLRGLQAGDYPRGGSVHLRLWLAEQIAQQAGAASLAGAPWVGLYARALGARIGDDVDLHAVPPVTGMLRIGKGASIEPEVDLSGYWIDGDVVRIGAIRIGARSTVGARSTLAPGTRIGKDAVVEPGSAVFGRVRSGERWSGSPARRVGSAKSWWAPERPPRTTGWAWAYGLSAFGLALIVPIALVAGGAVLATGIRGAGDLGEAWLGALAALVPAVVVAGLVLVALIVLVVRLLSIGLTEGVFPVHSAGGWRVWAIERVLDAARTILFPLYASLLTPAWLRLLGARVGREAEISTVLLIPKMATVHSGAFLADDTLVASYELGGGWVRVAHAEIGERAFLGNSGMAAAGNRIPNDALVGVLSAAPRKSKKGSSWLGSPPVRLRRTPVTVDAARTFAPPVHLRVARALWELGRIVPVIVTCAIGVHVMLALLWLADAWGGLAATLLSGVVMLAAGAVAAGVSTAAKWLLVGRIRATETPLWSSFVWRSEVADTFVEMVAAPWFAQSAAGSPALVWWLRSLGARIGHGVWCESYWLPEADLVTLGDASAVNRGCVVQTHLFHDRMMSIDAVALEHGATLGPHSVILPAARIGEHATVGPASLVMRGELVPDRSRWSGNPIGPWREVHVADYHAVSR